MPGGRPSKLTAALLTKLDAIADDGLQLKQVCAKLSIDASAFRRWEALEPDDGLVSQFHAMAARVRAGMGSAADDMAWGVLREVAEDPAARAADRLAAAQAILRLRIPHRVELTGKDGGPIRAAGPDLSRLSVEELRTLKALSEKASGE